MSLTDCPLCWDTPCSCGWEYRRYSVESLEKQVSLRLRALRFLLDNPGAKFSLSDSEAETDGDARYRVHMGLGLRAEERSRERGKYSSSPDLQRRIADLVGETR